MVPQRSTLPEAGARPSRRYRYSCLYLYGYGAIDPTSDNQGDDYQRGKENIHDTNAAGSL